VQALPVDVEPEPFWTGDDQARRVDAWKSDVGWREEWGDAKPAGRFNGSSGTWVHERVLAPLGVERHGTFLTDAVCWHCASDGVTSRIDDTYAPVAAALGLPEAKLPVHLSEDGIVRAASTHELPRIRRELELASPTIVVTLGNAALRVFRGMIEPGQTGRFPERLHAGDGYGQELRVVLDGRAFRWLPLAHPAAPSPFQQAHAGWIARRTATPASG
jgi:hypothetical protein